MLRLMIGGSLADTDDATKIGFKFASGWVDGIQANGVYRTFDLSVPATAKNNELMQFSNNTAYDGMRQAMEGVIIDGGIWMPGKLYLVSSTRERYELLFIHGRPSWDANGMPSGLFPDNMTVYDKMPSTNGGTIPHFGFYGYENGVGDPQSVGIPLDHMPCCNLGYYIDTIATAMGYTVNWPSVSGWLNPYSYGLMLPTCNVYNYDTVTFTGSPTGGYSVTIGGGGTLLDLGLQLTTKSYRRGAWAWPVDVEVFMATRPLRIRTNPGTTVIYAGERGYRIFNGDLAVPQGDVEFDIAAGEWFTLGNIADRHRQLGGNWKWYGPLASPAGYTTPVSDTFTVMENQGTPGNLSTVNLADNLPDLSLADALAAFCDIICGTYTVDTDAMTIDVVSLEDALRTLPVAIDLNKERITLVGTIKPYIDGWARSNRVRCKSEGYVTEECAFVRDYRCENEYLDKERIIGEIPFNDGNYILTNSGGVMYKTLWVEDVAVAADQSLEHKGVLTIFCEAPAGVPALHLQTTTDDGIGAAYNEFTAHAVTLEVTVRMPLYRYIRTQKGVLVHYMSKEWVVRSADWSDGLCRLVLLSYQPQPLPDWLRFTMPNGGTITLNQYGTPAARVFEYSVDRGRTWSEWTESGGVRTLTLTSGQTMLLRNASETSTELNSDTDFYYFQVTGECYAGGQLASLLCKDPADAVIVPFCFAYIFGGAGNPDLKTAPSVPKENLAEACLLYAFAYTGITSVSLPAASLADYAYASMMEGCSSLNEVWLHATDISATDCLLNWLYGVWITGTLHCPSSLALPSGASGLPSGWSRVNL